MNDKHSVKRKLTKDQLFKLPNVISYFRILLVPLIIWLYCVKSYYSLTLLVIIISAITDIVDGFIARKFNMITDFGKFIDPVADKLTQVAILFCLITRFPLMLLPLCIMFVKEILAFTIRYVVFKKTGEVHSAEWHGKLTTVMLYLITSLHVIWCNIEPVVSVVCILVASALMLLSSVLYTISSVMAIKRTK